MWKSRNKRIYLGHPFGHRNWWSWELFCPRQRRHLVLISGEANPAPKKVLSLSLSGESWWSHAQQRFFRCCAALRQDHHRKGEVLQGQVHIITSGWLKKKPGGGHPCISFLDVHHITRVLAFTAFTHTGHWSRFAGQQWPAEGDGQCRLCLVWTPTCPQCTWK